MLFSDIDLCPALYIGTSYRQQFHLLQKERLSVEIAGIFHFLRQTTFCQTFYAGDSTLSTSFTFFYLRSNSSIIHH